MSLMTDATEQREGTTGGTRVLVVDDEPSITDLVATVLRYEGFEVDVAANGWDALRKAGAFGPDLVILDIMLPDHDGFEIHRRLRDRGLDVPVIFLTARDATEDKVRGLTLGGDDYVTKPFSLEEVIARIRAVLRRARAGTPPPPTRLRAADLELDEESHAVWRAGRRIQLSPTEFKLLRYLMTNVGRVLSKGQILDYVWNYDFQGDSSIVESYVSYLRRNVGYVLRLPDA